MRMFIYVYVYVCIYVRCMQCVVIHMGIPAALSDVYINI